MKTFPDKADAKIIKTGSAKGSIVNYWPPKHPVSWKAAKRIATAKRQMAKLLKRRDR